MAFQGSYLRLAGQDSDFEKLPFPASEIPRSLRDDGIYTTPGKQMYEGTESILSWIDAIDYANKSFFKADDLDAVDVFDFATHPFRICRPHSPFSDEVESDSDVSFCFDSPAWAPAILSSAYFDGSDETRSELSDDAQYITIPFDSPWYRPPSYDPGPVSAHELSIVTYAESCSSEVRQAIAQQELLLAIFHQELRRAVPRDDDTDYNSDWLEDVDVDLVLAPLETYTDLCWESAVCEKSHLLPSKRPVPDVPTGFDDVHGIY